jgi:hypothetical protein
MKTTDPAFFAELTSSAAADINLTEEQATIEDEDVPVDVEDDSNLSCEEVIARVHNPSADVLASESCGLSSAADAESLDKLPIAEDHGTHDGQLEQTGESRRSAGKRKRRPNTLYAQFWRHHDNNNSEDESYE